MHETVKVREHTPRARQMHETVKARASTPRGRGKCMRPSTRARTHPRGRGLGVSTGRIMIIENNAMSGAKPAGLVALSTAARFS